MGSDQFSKPKDFSLKDRLMGSFSVFKGDGDFHVRIEFDDFAGRLVEERQWHHSQKVKEIPGGGVELSMKLNSLEEVERWVLGWGPHAKVIGPPQLKTRLRKAAQELGSMYADMPVWFRELRDLAVLERNDRLLQLVLSVDSPPEDPNQMRWEFEGKN